MIRGFEKFFEEYKSRLEDQIQGEEDLGKATAIKDIMVDCDAYVTIKDYINSLYVRKDNVHVIRMFDSIVKAIFVHIKDDREICEIIDAIQKAVNELDVYLEQRWSKSKRKNDYKRSEIRKYLSSLEDGPDIDTSIFGWKEFIRKKLTHAKYEDSFTEEGSFSKFQTQLFLGKLPIREYVFTDNVSESEVIDLFKQTIYDDSKLKLVKADLKTNKEIYDKSNNLVLDKGDLIEVKFKNFNQVDTLGEFYAITKGTISKKFLPLLDPNITLGRTNSKGNYLIGDLLKMNPELNDKYNDIIQKLYDIITGEEKDKGDEILRKIKDSFSGIMFSDNKYIKSEDLIIKWGMKGQRKHENRLSITHEPISNAKVYRYIDDPLNPHFRNPKIY